jgi:hypothetical protein
MGKIDEYISEEINIPEAKHCENGHSEDEN